MYAYMLCLAIVVVELASYLKVNPVSNTDTKSEHPVMSAQSVRLFNSLNIPNSIWLGALAGVIFLLSGFAVLALTTGIDILITDSPNALLDSQFAWYLPPLTITVATIIFLVVNRFSLNANRLLPSPYWTYLVSVTSLAGALSTWQGSGALSLALQAGTLALAVPVVNSFLLTYQSLATFSNRLVLWAVAITVIYTLTA